MKHTPYRFLRLYSPEPPGFIKQTLLPGQAEGEQTHVTDNMTALPYWPETSARTKPMAGSILTTLRYALFGMS
jgi:hypothetical protein